MTTKEDAIARLVFYLIAGVLMGTGFALLLGFAAFLITVGAVLLLWCTLVDVSLIASR